VNNTNYGVLESDGTYVDIVIKDLVGMCSLVPTYFKVTTSVSYFTDKKVSLLNIFFILNSIYQNKEPLDIN